MISQLIPTESLEREGDFFLLNGSELVVTSPMFSIVRYAGIGSALVFRHNFSILYSAMFLLYQRIAAYDYLVDFLVGVA